MKEELRGYLYIAFGEQYYNEAMVSAHSLRRLSPDANVALVTDKKRNSTLFDKVIEIEASANQNWKNGITKKIEGISSSIFDRTIYIDTDTYFYEPIDGLFDLLDFYDLLICHDAWEASDVEYNSKIIADYHIFNTGMIVFKKGESVSTLLTKWKQIYLHKMDRMRHDQPAFMEALLTSSVRLFVLPSIYNFRYAQNLSIHVNEKVKLLHGRGTEKQFAWLENRLNSCTEQRVWDATNQVCRSFHSRSSILDGLKRLFFKTYRRYQSK